MLPNLEGSILQVSLTVASHLYGRVVLGRNCKVYKVNNCNSNKLWKLNGECHIVVILSV